MEFADAWHGPPTPFAINEGSHPSSMTILIDHYGITGAEILVRPDPGESITVAALQFYNGIEWITGSTLTPSLTYPNVGSQPADILFYSPTRWGWFDDPYSQEHHYVRFIVESNFGTFLDDNEGDTYQVTGTVPEASSFALSGIAGVLLLSSRRRRSSR